MDVFNKLKSTVSQTVSQISTVLPGNPVTREFEVTNLTCCAGPGKKVFLLFELDLDKCLIFKY